MSGRKLVSTNNLPPLERLERTVTPITEIVFSVPTAEEIDKQAVVRVTSQSTHEQGVPVKTGLSSPLMGPSAPGELCMSCLLDYDNCSGHYGVVPLNMGVYRKDMLKTVLEILRSVCIFCASPLNIKIDTNDEEAKKKDDNRKKTKTCPTCNRNIATIYMRKDKLGLNVSFGKKDEGSNQIPLAANLAYWLLSRITNEQARALHLDPTRCRPEALIANNIVVPPPCVRPANMADIGGTRRDDDLTATFVGLIGQISQLPQGNPSDTAMQNSEDVATWTYNLLIDNSPNQKSDSTRTREDIRTKLSKKQGRFRKNANAKRVNSSCRSVIVGDPSLPLNSWGISAKVARNLPIEVYVTLENIEEIRSLILAGPNKVPGAVELVTPQNITYNLQYVNLTEIAYTILTPGCSVFISMPEGTPMLCNRQPTLHSASMMAHNVVVQKHSELVNASNAEKLFLRPCPMPMYTFRVNLGVTPPYGADFDGDEMNGFSGSTELTRLEIQKLAGVANHIVGVNGLPLISGVQDTILSASILTRSATRLNRRQMLRLVSWMPTYTGRLPEPISKNPDRWSGRQVISMMLPDINLTKKSHLANMPCDATSDETDVVIERGVLKSGILDVATLGPKKAWNIIHTIWIQKGPEVASEFLTMIQRVCNMWIYELGFTIDFTQFVLENKVQEDIATALLEGQEAGLQVIRQARAGKLQPSLGRTVEEEMESQIARVLSEYHQKAMRMVIKGMDRRKGIAACVFSGSKGKPVNLASLLASPGPQDLGGTGRAPNGLPERPTPWVLRGDIAPNARGFIMSSYGGGAGLSLQECFFVSCSARNGIISTTLGTSTTGYIFRRYAKTLEDQQALFGGTISNSRGRMTQLFYGGDGINGRFSTPQLVEHVTMDDKQFSKVYEWGHSDKKYLSKHLSSSLDKEKTSPFLQKIKDDRHWLRYDACPSMSLLVARTPNNKVEVSVPIRMIINDALKTFSPAKFPYTEMSPLEIDNLVNELVSDLRQYLVSKDDKFRYKLAKYALLNLRILARSTLASKRVILEYKFTKNTFMWVLSQIEAYYARSIIDPGTLVGILAAQSAAEPLTQASLSYFHSAGQIGKNVAHGLPRQNELISSRQCKTPSMDIALKNSTENPYSIVLKFELTMLSSIVQSNELIRFEDPFKSSNEETQQVIDNYLKFSYSTKVPDDLSNWGVKLIFNRSAMANKQVRMAEVKEVLNLTDSGMVITTPDTATTLIAIVYFSQYALKEDNTMHSGNMYMRNLIAKTKFRGINGLHDVDYFPRSVIHYPAEGPPVTKEEMFLQTSGSNLADVLIQPEVDISKTTGNNPHHILEILGVFAAQVYLERELLGNIQFDGSFIEPRHITTIVSHMTHLGHILDIGRRGMSRQADIPLARISFEKTIENLVVSSIAGETDNLKGPTGAIIYGQQVQAGTTSFDVLLGRKKTIGISDALALIKK